MEENLPVNEALHLELAELRQKLAEYRVLLENAELRLRNLETLNVECAALRQRIIELNIENATVKTLTEKSAHLEKVLNDVTSSASYKIGRKLVALARKIPGLPNRFR